MPQLGQRSRRPVSHKHHSSRSQFSTASALPTCPWARLHVSELYSMANGGPRWHFNKVKHLKGYYNPCIFSWRIRERCRSWRGPWCTLSACHSLQHEAYRLFHVTDNAPSCMPMWGLCSCAPPVCPAHLTSPRLPKDGTISKLFGALAQPLLLWVCKPNCVMKSQLKNSYWCSVSRFKHSAWIKKVLMKYSWTTFHDNAPVLFSIKSIW